MTDNATITIYGITPAGDLQWYRHDGGADGTNQWTAGDGGNNVGSGWNTASIVFSDGAGVIYAVTPAGDLQWYHHDGWVDGTNQWTAGDGGNNVGSGWNMYATVFSGGAGVVYGITPAGDLHWYRHDGWVDGTNQWTAGDGGNNVGSGWNMYATVFS
ncbi:tachylectin-related carbohydrate-binding protein, partial [Streptomyces rishiriensis]|uniref:tachylectin-related carbohydrate-binding protein n=1 Tax=Streptomyces rishiriensis TaxID=68264 RepID=UPI00379ACFA2